jgi:hypothetical protein
MSQRRKAEDNKVLWVGGSGMAVAQPTGLGRDAKERPCLPELCPPGYRCLCHLPGLLVGSLPRLVEKRLTWVAHVVPTGRTCALLIQPFTVYDDSWMQLASLAQAENKRMRWTELGRALMQGPHIGKGRPCNLYSVLLLFAYSILAEDTPWRKV